jgi:glutamine amidotransferase
MGHLVAYFGNEPENTACALFSARNALFSKSLERGDGWALGFIQGGDVLLQERPRAEAKEVDLYALARELKADAIIARVGLARAGTPAGSKSSENAGPFRFRSWLFGSVGNVPSFALIRERMLEAVPGFLRRNLRGPSAAEHLFHIFLAYLHDAGVLDQPSPDPRRVETALHATLTFTTRLIAEATEGHPADHAEGQGMELAVVATNGRSLVATVCSHAMQFLRVDGIADCPVCHGRADSHRDGRRIAHEQLRAVVIEADPDTQGRPGWRPITEGTALVVGPDRVPNVVPVVA